MTRETRYVRSRDAHIAYHVSGSGPHDVLLRSYRTISVHSTASRGGPISSSAWRVSRVIRHDVREISLSDPIDPGAPPMIEEEVEDAIAVLDGAGA